MAFGTECGRMRLMLVMCERGSMDMVCTMSRMGAPCCRGAARAEDDQTSMLPVCGAHFVKFFDIPPKPDIMTNQSTFF